MDIILQGFGGPLLIVQGFGISIPERDGVWSFGCLDYRFNFGCLEL